jgi:lipoprotein NlpD
VTHTVWTRLAPVLALAALLAACGTHTYHIVQRGDSLYSISWSYGYDHRLVAKWNGLQPPYELKVGQRIRFVPPPGSRAPVSSATQSRETAPPPKPVPPVAKTSPPAPAPSVARKPGEPGTAGARDREQEGITWMWPTEGNVIARFDASDALKKGIDIAGALGQPVRAAAKGRVVYSGSGLIGYGKLIILKHNDTLLSAYAHNKELLVAEGDIVDAGRQIAAMGSSGENVVMLHFEIRRDGQPVDPLAYLPERSSP